MKLETKLNQQIKIKIQIKNSPIHFRKKKKKKKKIKKKKKKKKKNNFL